jgi:hypothetical protein
MTGLAVGATCRGHPWQTVGSTSWSVSSATPFREFEQTEKGCRVPDADTVVKDRAGDAVLFGYQLHAGKAESRRGMAAVPFFSKRVESREKLGYSERRGKRLVPPLFIIEGE